ncbi:MAG: Integrase, catalytic region [Rhodanobacteraceae bacterium]|jgi:IS30 family transposase|nr:MAG: Integrase, catalytic region [Rhodanobacteraceae bacterium]WHZ18688.1 MAG: Integrase, catalytic region [Rhodanobacteraceae bacterium]WHZ18859.1 MAG: Integrase, catalytic region [Rhodanobacteraceae bacterium]WHZ19154.1 MAG: Integrase, catalytic region [Rhodanobacteraceae bacterium]WHZ20167.1 MAG: Integrase, catalytic region [Rhodanobacteraceae bacterium]
MSYAHLSQEERYQIRWLRNGGWTLEDIGLELRRSPSTISRELRRNATPKGAYDHRDAQRQAVQRRHAASALPRIGVEDWAKVEARLREDWSPEQIAGTGDVAISIERIYQHIAADRQRGGTLWQHLRRRKRRRRHRCGTPRERQRFGGRRIHERPAIVERRGRVGDFEGDTLVGKGPARIVTLVDRKSGWVRLRKVSDGTATAVAEAVLSVLHPVRACVHTLTWDNGSEFAEHRLMDVGLGADSYFATPYASWQRGCNENLNGLVRQYIPKGCDISLFTDDAIQQIEDKLNRRPRKRLGYRTPEQVFELSFKRVALRS